MAATVARKRKPNRRSDVLQKPRGVIHPRVQKVGPEHFGIVAVDCAKARSKWMLADFYGNVVVVAPTVVEHCRAGFASAVATLREAVKQRDIRDLLVAVERTGRHHHPPARAFAAGGFEVRTVHPFTTKQFRQPADPGNKTDDTDLFDAYRKINSHVRHRFRKWWIAKHKNARLDGRWKWSPWLEERFGLLQLKWDPTGSVSTRRKFGACSVAPAPDNA